ncbi:SDR family NAD(P)-dependent oxidoreductase [Sphingopyxis indica]|uniref:SDR family NAD(P)-dependent oxidoreductase n=1 Tax=Sphingopyxis indica TaxID=436663 RepID=UPI002938D9AE|nr:SDR family NAD(P)-dependent oxidoreductase [Sphingopyxis indica]WOF44574.1 SDR family NAD(P)-dependent oxidoreductase [Sphingopyxis indica]
MERSGVNGKIFITGTAGFIGFHLATLLLDEGLEVVGYDGMTDYYDPQLKRRRHQNLLQNARFSAVEAMLEDRQAFDAAVDSFVPDVIVHLAGQAGVRYSLEAPESYVQSNVIGSFHVLEAARRHAVRHLLIASTSSVYGANGAMPFRETDKADLQVSFYGATKKAVEAMAHSYAHLWDIPTTMFRFFTVYGPWGRPDMALFKFVDAILAGRPIDVYNEGMLSRDFTYVGDLARAVRLLIDVPPVRPLSANDIKDGDSLSPVAPYRVVNIGAGQPVPLLDFVKAVENAVRKRAQHNLLPMQSGDVVNTWAECSLLAKLTGYQPQTSLDQGVAKFVTWYRGYYAR